MDVAYNRPDVTFEKAERGHDDEAQEVPLAHVGFRGEVYRGDEEGFRTWRTEDGKAKRPEVQSQAGKRVPTEEEMDDLMKLMERGGPSSGGSTDLFENPNVHKG